MLHPEFTASPDRSMPRDNHLWIEREQCVNSFDPSRKQAVNGKWCNPDKANVACQQYARLREPDCEICERMGRRKDMQFASSWQSKLVNSWLWDYQFEMIKTTTEVRHQSVIHLDRET